MFLEQSFWYYRKTLVPTLPETNWVGGDHPLVRGVAVNSGMTLDESPAAELWRRTLSQITSVFGRLVYLASLRDPNTGKYVHFGFAQRFTDREADLTLRRSHSNIFEDWLSFSLEEQKEDLEHYLNALDQDPEVVLENWRAMPPFANFIPVSTQPQQRELFISDLLIVMQLIQ